jgi:hypothetical protein
LDNGIAFGIGFWLGLGSLLLGAVGFFREVNRPSTGGLAWSLIALVTGLLAAGAAWLTGFAQAMASIDC